MYSREHFTNIACSCYYSGLLVDSGVMSSVCQELETIMTKLLSVDNLILFIQCQKIFDAIGKAFKTKVKRAQPM